MSAIGAVLTDIGEVVLAVHYDRLGQAVGERTGWSIEEVERRLRSAIEDFETELETGRITLREGFERHLGSLSGLMSYEQFERAWQSAIGEDYRPVRDAYHALPPEVGLYVLSNTNDAHATVVHRHWLARRARAVWLSNEIGLAKPDPAVFAYAIQRISLPARRILFLDDRSENIAAAREAGMAVWQVTDPEEVPDVLGRFGVALSETR